MAQWQMFAALLFATASREATTGGWSSNSKQRWISWLYGRLLTFLEDVVFNHSQGVFDQSIVYFLGIQAALYFVTHLLFLSLLWFVYSCLALPTVPAAVLSDSSDASDSESDSVDNLDRSSLWRQGAVSWVWMTLRFSCIVWFWGSYSYLILVQIYSSCTKQAGVEIVALVQRVKRIRSEEHSDTDQASERRGNGLVSFGDSSPGSKISLLKAKMSQDLLGGAETHGSFLAEYHAAKQRIKTYSYALCNVWLLEVLSCFILEPFDVKQFARVGPVQALASLADSAMRYYWVLHRMLSDASMINYDGERLVKRAARKMLISRPPTPIPAIKQWEELVLHLTDDWIKWEHFFDNRSDFTLRTKILIAVLCLKFGITSDIWKKFFESTSMMFLM